MNIKSSIPLCTITGFCREEIKLITRVRPSESAEVMSESVTWAARRDKIWFCELRSSPSINYSTSDFMRFGSWKIDLVSEQSSSKGSDISWISSLLTFS